VVDTDPDRYVSCGCSGRTRVDTADVSFPFPYSVTRLRYSDAPRFPKPRKILSCGSRSKRIHKGAQNQRGICHLETKAYPTTHTTTHDKLSGVSDFDPTHT
jgi:hypothetical protein